MGFLDCARNDGKNKKITTTQNVWLLVFVNRIYKSRSLSHAVISSNYPNL